MTHLNMQRANELVRRLSVGEGSGPDQYELLQQVFAGYPIMRLQPMVESADLTSVRTSASILAEAGDAGSSAGELLDRLLRHEDGKVRYYAIQAVLGSGSALLAKQAATALALLEDESGPVGRSAMQLLAHAPEDQLRAAFEFLDAVWRSRVSVVLDRDATDSSGSDAQNAPRRRVDRLVALAWAIRKADIDVSALRAAALSDDEEIRDLARHVLTIFEGRRADRSGSPPFHSATNRDRHRGGSCVEGEGS